MKQDKRHAAIEASAQKLYNLFTAQYTKPDNPLELDLVKLIESIGGTVYELTQWRNLDPNTPTIETLPDGTFILTVINHTPSQAPHPSKSFTHRLACLLGTYLLHYKDKPAGIHETHHERWHGRHSNKAHDGLYFARCLMLPKQQFLTEWEKRYWGKDTWKFDLANTFGVDHMWVEVRARELNLMRLNGKTFKTPTLPK